MFNESGLHIVGGTGIGNGNVNCRFESVNAISTTDNITCLLIDGDSNTCLTEDCTFIDCRFDIHTTAGSRSGIIRNAHGLDIVPQGEWALTADEAASNQGITLLPEDYQTVLDLMKEQPDREAVLVVDHYYMNGSRLDYEWLYDNVGMRKLMKQ